MNENDIQKVKDTFDLIKAEIKKVIIGQDEVINDLIIALFVGGHVLIEGVPGLGKTLLSRVLSIIVGGKFKRIQFTPDLMPSDIIGTTIYNSEINKFQVKKGPVFTNLLLADEINRAPAKTQSALLQAMQERQVNIDGTNYPLGEFFITLATQNPIEMEGTYPLPEAQTDRFLMKIFIDYPVLEEEKMILNLYQRGFNDKKLELEGLAEVLNQDKLIEMKEIINTVNTDEKIIDYIAKIITLTRNYPGIEIGSSPRGSVSLLKCAKVKAAISGRDYVTPDDVKEIAMPILRHRIILEAEMEIEGTTPDDILGQLIEEVEVPK